MTKATPATEAEPQAPAPATSAPVQGVTVDQLVAPLPDVNEAAIAAEAEDQSAQAAAAAQDKPAEAPAAAPKPAPSAPLGASKPAAASKPAPTDEQGRTFDPRLHECTAEGAPIFRAGSIYLKRRRRPLKEWKSASVVAEPPPAPDPAAQPVQPQQAGPTPEQFRLAQQATAQTMAGLQLLIMRRAFGDSIAKKNEEAEQLVGAWVAVLDHYNVGPVHPVVGLVVVSGALVLANVNDPKTQSRLARMRDWFERVALGLWQRIRRRLGWGGAEQREAMRAEPEEGPARKVDEEPEPATAERNGHGRAA